MNKKSISIKELDRNFAKKISQASYAKKPRIDGVQVIHLTPITSEDGYFLELARLTEESIFSDLPDIKLRQISYSVVNPGGIKAWHLHLNQEDVWFIPPESTVTVGLYDLRKDSPTKDLCNKLVLGNHKAQLLLIPRGVAHGMANNSTIPVSMIYFLNQQFNLQNPDEYRLPWDHFGKDFWKIAKG